MQPAFFIGTFCWLAAALVYVVGYRRAARRYDIIFEVPTVAAKDLPGLGAAMVEVKGIVRCRQPLISDLARVACVAFDCSVTEHWTTTRIETDSKGRSRTVTEHHSEVRYGNAVRIPFEVHDAGGRVLVEPEAADIDMLDSMGDLSGPLPDSPAFDVGPFHGGSLHYAESVLPLEQRVYVLGQVGPEHQIRKPADYDRPFIISHKAEEALLHQARWGKRLYAVLTVVLIVGGAIGMLMGAGAAP